MRRRLGVDIGGVIIEPADENAKASFFNDQFLRTPSVPGALDALEILDDLFDGQVYLVSKCAPRVEERIRRWLAHHGLYRRTGIRAGQLHFCQTRQEKAPIVAQLGLTHFIDNRLEVLGYLSTVGHRYLFRPDETEVRAHEAHLSAVQRVQSWPELVYALRDG